MTKKEQIINTALILFYQKGLHAVGINEILTESNVAKKTLYNYFKSKDDLICACLSQRDTHFNEWLKSVCDKKQSIDIAVALFDALQAWFAGQVPELGEFNGCFFINSAAEYPDPHHPIAKQCIQHKEAVFNILLNALLKTPELANDHQKATRIAQTLLTLKEGLICQARVMHNQRMTKPTKQFLACIMSP